MPGPAVRSRRCHRRIGPRHRPQSNVAQCCGAPRLLPIAAFNYFGFTAVDSRPSACATTFTGPEHGILYVAAYVRSQYLTPGGRWFVTPTLRGMNVHYATDPRWADSIARIADQV